MVTSSKLTPDLKAIKNVMPMRLIAFEQANIDMRMFFIFYSNIFVTFSQYEL